MDMVVHKCQPLSKDRTHYADTTTTLQPHHITLFSKFSVVSQISVGVVSEI